MIKISCEMCMDLIPLVRDGIASPDSCQAVRQHIETCPQCRELFDGTVPPAADNQQALEQLRRKAQLFSAMLLMFGILFGLGLTSSSGLFYNIIIMPLIGAVGYFIFHWKALYLVPGLLLGTHLLTNALGLIRGVEHLDLPSLLLWNVLYCIFALIGTIIAGLLHFALRKEP
ncbi:MAG: zf-HC2 domain-containing protein [Oscillospiraceae bacterium]|nr:zf-HC2 domain-containing protein [Oscillospiraceae bacterium]